MSKKPFGRELILDMKDCLGNITSKEHIQIFIDTLISKIGMQKKGDTIFEYFEDNQYNRERDIVGYSIVQIISLSNITIHINEISKSVYFNLFTCGDLNELKVVLLVSNYFLPSKMKKQIITRDAY
jgi:S-adenosylmethionine/arginine decarboxylase-like enzyme